MCAQQVIGIIPARFGSSRFPGKMLASIAGKTLIQHTWENAARFTCLDELVVATDDTRIFDHVHAFGGQAVMTCTSCLTGTDRLAEVVQHNPRYAEAALIVNVQGDDPFLSEETVRLAVEHMLVDDHAAMGTAVCLLTCSQEAADPSVVKCVLDRHGNALYFSRSLIPGGHTLTMQKGHSYYRHIGLYIYRPAFLLEYGKLAPTPLQKAEDLEQLKVLEHGYRIRAAVVPSLTGIHINTPEDLNRAKLLLCPQNSSSSLVASAPL